MAHFEFDAILAGLPDTDDDAIVPQSPRSDDLVAMDRAFDNSDYALESEDDAPTFSKDTTHEIRPMRKRAAVRLCKSASELAALDRLMLESVGVKL